MPVATRTVENKCSIEQVLTCNGTGQVILARNNQTRFIVKRVNALPNNSKNIANEIWAGLHFKHPNIVKMIKYCKLEKTKGWVSLIFEYVDGMDLFDFLSERKFKPLPEAMVKNIFAQLVSALW
jgi:serine/threonine protein kinase